MRNDKAESSRVESQCARREMLRIGADGAPLTGGLRCSAGWLEAWCALVGASIWFADLPCWRVGGLSQGSTLTGQRSAADQLETVPGPLSLVAGRGVVNGQ